MPSSAYIFAIGMILGGLIELTVNYILEIISKKPLRLHYHFHLMQKVSLATLPLWGVFALILTKDQKFVTLFIYSAVIGTVLEYLLAKTINFFFGIHLWSYKYGAIGKYTSIYSPVYWGGAGIFFSLLAGILGV